MRFSQLKSKKQAGGDILRDCRKSPKIAISGILNYIKSITYSRQNHRFRVFRQSLRIPQIDLSEVVMDADNELQRLYYIFDDTFTG